MKSYYHVFWGKWSIYTILFILFLYLRFLHLPEFVVFGSDQGRDFLAVWDIYKTHHIPLIGPPSEYMYMGHAFFFGPASYYVLYPALLLGKWNVLMVSYFLIVLNAFAFLFSILILDRYIKTKNIIYIFATFLVFTPYLVSVSQSYWNPNFMLPVGMLLLAFLVMTQDKKFFPSLLFLSIGLLWGLGLNFHYAFSLVMLVSIVWLMIKKQINLLSFLFLGVGFVIGFFPILLFELRNNFYNLRTLLLVLGNSGKENNQFSFNTFYLIGLLPFFFYLLSVYLAKIPKVFMYILISIYIVWSLFSLFQIPKQKLSYPTLELLASSIEKDHPGNFNIADQLTSDNRAMALRYLLTAADKVPNGVTDYDNSSTLFLYSDQPFEKLTQNPVYELSSFVQYRSIKKEKITDTISLYTLEK